MRSEALSHVVRLCGGLGNQLFQYAFGVYLQQQLGSEVRYDIHNGFVSDVFARTYRLHELGIRVPTAPQTEIPFGVRNSVMVYRLVKQWRIRVQRGTSPVYWERRRYARDNGALKVNRSTYYFGYWQWIGYTSWVLRSLHGAVARIVTRLALETPFGSGVAGGIGIHARCRMAFRADGSRDRSSMRRYEQVSRNYFQAALARLPRDLPVFVFSDDRAMAAQMLPPACQPTFFSGLSDAEEFALLSSCKYQILSNSTFSWWAGRLNGSEENVVAPAKWLADAKGARSGLLPAGWQFVDS